MDYAEAEKRVRELRGFYIHAVVYLSVIGMLAIVDLLDQGNWWFYWPALGWGVAIVIHATSVLFENSIFGTRWEEKKIHELMAGME